MTEIKVNKRIARTLWIACNTIQSQGVGRINKYFNDENMNKIVKDWIKETKKEFDDLQYVKKQLENILEEGE